MQKDTISFNYRQGLYHSEDEVDVPDGALLSGSSNVIYNRKGRPISFKDLNPVTISYGGSRAFALDSDLVGLLGLDNSANKGVGNMLQGPNRSLWFVGNAITGGVRVLEDFSTLKNIGGTSQVETVLVTAAATAGGNLTVRITGAYVAGSPVDVVVAVLNGDTTSTVAQKVVTALQANASVTAQYYPRVSGSNISLTDKNARANDATLAITLQAAGGTGVTFGASTDTTAGAVATAADLSSTPQFAKFNGTDWDSPVQVGLAPETTAPELILTTDATRDALFTGLITGSISLRVARKRNGAVSIASGASNVVTGDTDSVYATIPDWTEDGSDQADREWLLYFTFTGQGSQAAHLLFPIEIPESKLDGSETTGWSSIQGNAKVKVISQHASTQAERKIEVEFLNNDLLLISPFEDYYPAESCKFLTQLGNVMCLIGTGDDSTGFDVSYPNNREAYSPDWRDWFAEVPVSLCQHTETGIFWVLGANTTYQGRWTGNTQESAPVVLAQASSKYGAIGQGASVSVNGVLYALSAGKTPFRIDQNRNIDDEFGTRVKQAFSSFDSTTQVGWFEDYNLVVFICDRTAIGYQIDTNVWTSLCTMVTTNDEPVDSCFSLNGKLYVSYYDPTAITPAYGIYEWDGGSGGNWSAVSSFQTGKSGLLLKDIIEAKVGVEVEAQPATFTFTAYKNFRQSSPSSLFTFQVTATGITISPRIIDVESLDYDNISLVASGTAGGQTVHMASLVVDIHSIERGN